MMSNQDNNSIKYNLLQEDVFKTFAELGEVLEIRIIDVWGKSPAWNGFAKGTVSGYFDNFTSFYNAALKAIKNQQGNVYFTLQVIDPRLIGRAYNKLKPTSLSGAYVMTQAMGLNNQKVPISELFKNQGVVRIRGFADHPESPYSWGGQVVSPLYRVC